MSTRRRPPRDVRETAALAKAVIEGRQAEARTLAEKLLAKQATE